MMSAPLILRARHVHPARSPGRPGRAGL